SFDWQQSQTFLLGEPFSFIPGISDGLSTISALRFGQEWVSRSPERVFAVRSQFSVGLDLFNATINDNGRDGRFFSWQGQFQYLEKLSDKLILSTQVSGQFSPDKLLPLEQFQIGGIYSVRGYDDNILQGEQGINGTIELHLALFDDQQWGRLEIYPFFDFGAVWNNQDDLPSEAIAGTGLGLLWQRDPIRLRLDYAFPLTETQQEQNLYISVQIGKSF
ncbi:MAG: ShlB/FhaC/HecB family hemolysin secretion/activation protein, partial [Microcystaceae cyanobacterium]